MLVSPEFDIALAGILGLLIGSFLNVVIYRLPLMLERRWLQESAEMLSDANELSRASGLVLQEAQKTASTNLSLFNAIEKLPNLSLALPQSRCQKCGHAIHWYENIPVLSYAFLRGKCSVCKTAISPRYPLIELATAGMFVLVSSQFGLTLLGLVWAIFASILIVQFFIDFDTQLLPDDLNYPLLWLGILVSALGWTIPLSSSVWGAVAGYLCLWLVFQGFKLLTGKEGMGYGDFKLLAALGAWFGADHLIAIVLLSSLVGSVIGGGLLVFGKLASKEIPIPFGPFLAGAGLLCLALGPGKLEQWLPFAFPLSQLAR